MRLHPAVATALILVGGALLVLPVYEWFQYARAHQSAASDPTRGPVMAISFGSAMLGATIILIATVMSIDPRPNAIAPPGPDRVV